MRSSARADLDQLISHSGDSSYRSGERHAATSSDDGSGGSVGNGQELRVKGQLGSPQPQEILVQPARC